MSKMVIIYYLKNAVPFQARSAEEETAAVELR